jgi:hypothetical protein
MTEKQEIIRELGEDGLLLPVQLNAALEANDRIKYYFTLLQTAVEQAEHPDRQFPTLRTERETAGIASAELDAVVLGSNRNGQERYVIPLLADILAATDSCLEEMLVPLLKSNHDGNEPLLTRKRSLSTRLPAGNVGMITRQEVQSITSGDPSRGDSFHLLVMDIHKALNRLQEQLAEVSIDGAKAYFLPEDDVPLVRAFMAGLNRTAPLKFDHPGLGTTATRSGEKIIIQNDIGVTDAHVLVIHIAGMDVSIMYTDIHMQRLVFFESLFDSRNVRWEDTVSRRGTEQFEKNVYHLSVGKYTAKDQDDLSDFLSFLGSRIVFLIDWNRARKQLRNFLLNKDSIAVLKWAADHDIGHRGFLRLGGDKLLYAALELAARVPLRYGEPLHQLLGRDRSVEYVKWVLRTATTGLLEGQSQEFLQDEIKAELLRYFRTAHEGLMEILIEHASLIVEVGTALHDAFLRSGQPGCQEYRERSARRAKEWESRADHLVSQVRDLSRRIEEAEFFFTLIMTADDVLDYLEEASYTATYLSSVKGSEAMNRQLAAMADLAVNGSQEYLRMLVAARTIRRESNRDEMQDFLAAVSRVVEIERECDEALRQAQKTILLESCDHKELWIYIALARIIEEATNSLMKSVYTMHDHVLESMNR